MTTSMLFRRSFGFRLLIAALFVFLGSTFQCSDLTKSTHCTQLNGCSWSGSACSGTYAPSCVPPNCYYVVDSSISVAVPDGSVLNPYTSVTDAIAKVTTGLVGTVVIINSNDHTSVNHWKSLTIAGTVIVHDSLYRINVNSTTNPYFSVSRTLKISGAYFNHTFTGAHIAFNLNNNALLYFENVHIPYAEMNGFAGFWLRALASASNATFMHIGGSISNMTAKSQILGGTTVWRNLNISNISTGGLIAFGGTVTFDNVTIKSITATNLFTLAASMLFTITNSLCQDMTGSLFTSTTVKTITITNSIFQNISPAGGQFISISGVPSDGTGGIHTIRNCTFKDSAISQTLFYVIKSGVQVIFQDVKMDNIWKSSSLSTSSLIADSTWPGGLACMTNNDAVIRVYNSNFTNFGSHSFGFKSSLVDIQNSIFDNSQLSVTTQEISEEVISTLTKNSGVTWVNIEDGSTLVTGGTTMTFKNNKFIENKVLPLYGGAIRLTGLNNLQLVAENNIFIGNKAGYGGAIYGSNVLLGMDLDLNTFEYNTAYDGGAIYKLADEFTGKVYLPSISTTQDTFYKNTAIRNGGALSLDWESMAIDNSVFSTGSAENGGAIYFINLDAAYNDAYGSMKEAKFTHNRASNVGGALKLFFDLQNLNDDASDPAYYYNNTDHVNEAISSGMPSYYMFSFYDVLVEKTFTELDDLSAWTKNAKRTVLDSKLAFTFNTSETTTTRQVKHKSGHEMTCIVKIEIYDTEHKLANYISKEELSVQITSTANSTSSFEAYVVASPVYLTFTDGAIYFKTTVKMIGEPGSTAVLNFQGLSSTSNMLSALGILMDYNINILFIDCEVGDLYDSSTQTCDTCVAGTYSFDDPYSKSASCYQCESTQETCLGGSKIAPKPGYWRYDVTSSSVLECPEKAACQGGLVDDVYYPEGLCAHPYEGNLCNKCAADYAKFGSEDVCSNCEKDGLYYVKFVGFFILRVGAVIYSVKCNLDKLSNTKNYSQNDPEITVKQKGKKRKKISNRDFQSNLMKIVVNFLQVSTVVLQYKFDWPDFIQKAVNVTNKFIPAGSDGFSVDCIVAVAYGDNTYTYFANLIITLIQPFGLWLGMIIVYLIYLKVTKVKIRGNPIVKRSITLFFLITSFLLQPSLIQSTLELFKCQNYTAGSDNSTYFMAKDSEIQCWTPFHILWSVGIALPFFLLWGVVLPVILFRKLVLSSKNLEHQETYSQYAFVYEGMKKKRYYWEFVILIRKTLIVIIFVFVNIISVQAQAFATFLVLLIFSAFQIKFRPYCDKRLNRIELLSLITSLVMTYSGMFFLSGGSTDALNILLIIISLIFNIFFYLVLALYFFKSYKKAAAKMKKGLSKMKTKFERSKTRKNSNNSNNSNSNSSSSDNNISSDEESSRPSGDMKELEAIMDEIQLDSPLQIPKENDGEQPQDDDRKDNSDSNLSDIPVESFSEMPGRGESKVVYNPMKSEKSNLSVMRNSGYQGSNQNSFNSGLLAPNLNRNNSMNSSAFNLLSPHLSTDRKLLRNMSGNFDSNFLKPGRPVLEKLDVRGFQSGAMDSPSSQRMFAMNQDESSSVPKISNFQFNYDESILLKIPNSPADGGSSSYRINYSNEPNEIISSGGDAGNDAFSSANDAGQEEDEGNDRNEEDFAPEDTEKQVM